jgi:endonuclease/exonuclease/phosphatase family metal-dependent hydrolase
VHGYEPRACLCLSIGVAGLRAANVHLGLGRHERRRQLRMLLAETGPQLHGGGPMLLGGDFNDWPPGPVTSTLEATFVDVARRRAARPPKTFPSWLPLLRLDRLYLAGRIDVLGCEVDASAQARAASDHLPLIAEICAHVSEDRIQ